MRSPVETYEGTPCKHGHVTPRNTTIRLCSTGDCVYCARTKSRRSHAKVGRLTRFLKTESKPRRVVSPGQIALL